ncbi:MAG: c-type cytochrome [bacterium]|nr:c-type cytochrome [bacterium]
MTTDTKNDVPNSESEGEDEKSFFARGVLLGLFGGALAAILVISIFASVLSLVDDVFGSSTAAVADSNEPPTGEASLIATGEDLATTKGCVGCHSTDGLDGVGPTWSGLGATTDDDYIRLSITDPNADIAAGFAPDLMPAIYADTLSSDDLDALVAYIGSL